MKKIETKKGYQQVGQMDSVSQFVGQRGGQSVQAEAVEKYRAMVEKRRQAKERLDQEIFNHFFLGYNGNG